MKRSFFCHPVFPVPSKFLFAVEGNDIGQ
jgi:hypothetical protein